MKKISFIALAIIASTALFAQDEPTLRTERTTSPTFGIKLGVSLAKFRGENFNPAPNWNRKTTINGGLTANFPMGKGAFAPELLYMGAGSKFDFTPTGGPTVAGEQDLHYIALPLMFQIKPAAGFFIELGPQVGYLVSVSGDEDNALLDEEGFDNFDLAINGGLGYMSRIGLGINARYSYGLTGLLSETGQANFGDAELKNSAIQFGLTYMFGANK